MMHTMEEIVKLFRYEPETGNLYWLNPLGKAINRQYKGVPSGSLNNRGYVGINVNGKYYLAHRIIFYMHHGYLPKYIDHINNIRADNRIENLRAVTKAQNGANQKVKGVSWNKQAKKWQAHIGVNGKRSYLGYFTNEIDAARAYNAAALKHFGEFARTNEGI